ncbi:MAG: FlgD immunoglobulin-like domain containing protein, partial [Candidatus Glassbacteria bacterium]
LPGVLQVGRSYDIDFYADFNKNGTYNAPPVDHAWRLMVSAVDTSQTLEFIHNTSFTDIMYPANPGPFDLVLNFIGMTPHVGQKFALRVVDSLTGMSVADTMIAALDSANFEIEFEDVLQKSRSYYVDFYADFNKNGAYDAPPVDHAWRLMVPMISGIVRLSFTHNTTFTNVMFPSTAGPFDLTVNFIGMTLHLGNKFELRVVDSTTGYVAGMTTIKAVASADFQVMLPMILQAGRSYNVDFYADFNRNGMYDAPPVDHAWRMMVSSASADTTLSFTHNVNFTDIMYPMPVCGCDLNQDGMVGMDDIVEWALEHMESLGYVEPCLDRNGDGMVKINDAIALLIDIRMGTCPEMMGPMLAGAQSGRTGSRKVESLSREQIEFLENLMVQLNLTPEEQAAYLLAIHGDAGKSALPKAFALAQNWPNPFNPSTTISYSVPEGNAEKVTLRVYDLRGKLVKTLVDQVREAGAYSVYWDGTDESGRQTASGVYFYRLSAGSFTQTRKMVLLK